jgi:hypothetical protein
VKPIEEKRGDKDPELEQCHAVGCRKEVQSGKYKQRWPQEDSHTTALHHDPNDKKGEKRAARQSPQFLKHLHTARDLFDLPRSQISHLSQTGNNADRVLDRSERQREAARNQQSRY